MISDSNRLKELVHRLYDNPSSTEQAYRNGNRIRQIVRIIAKKYKGREDELKTYFKDKDDLIAGIASSAYHRLTGNFEGIQELEFGGLGAIVTDSPEDLKFGKKQLHHSKNSGESLRYSINYGESLMYSINTDFSLIHSKNFERSLFYSRNSGFSISHSENSGWSLLGSTNLEDSLYYSLNNNICLSSSKNFDNSLNTSKNSQSALEDSNNYNYSLFNSINLNLSLRYSTNKDFALSSSQNHNLATYESKNSDRSFTNSYSYLTAEEMESAIENSKLGYLLHKQINTLADEKHKLKLKLLAKGEITFDDFRAVLRYQADDTEFIKLLGEGQMGKAFLVYNYRYRKLLCMKVQKNLESELDETFLIKEVEQENIPRIIKGPDVTYYMDDIRTNHKSNSFLMEFIVGENLSNLMRENKNGLENVHAFHYSKQLLKCIEFMIKSDLQHRDLHPANIIITPKNQIKVIDFGVARRVNSQLTDKKIINRRYGGSNDLFSWGLLTYKIFTGKHLIYERNEEENIPTQIYANYIYQKKSEVRDSDGKLQDYFLKKIYNSKTLPSYIAKCISLALENDKNVVNSDTLSNIELILSDNIPKGPLFENTTLKSTSISSSLIASLDDLITNKQHLRFALQNKYTVDSRDILSHERGMLKVAEHIKQTISKTKDEKTRKAFEHLLEVMLTPKAAWWKN